MWNVFSDPLLFLPFGVPQRLSLCFKTHLMLLSLGGLTLKFYKFFLLGLIVFIGGIALNVFLVEICAFDKPFAYLFVVAFQAMLGFILNKYVIFEKVERNNVRLFFDYAIALLVFRGFDWLLYSALVEVFLIKYVVAQGMNTCLIFLAKYFLYKKLFEGRLSIFEKGL